MRHCAGSTMRTPHLVIWESWHLIHDFVEISKVLPFHIDMTLLKRFFMPENVNDSESISSRLVIHPNGCTAASKNTPRITTQMLRGSIEPVSSHGVVTLEIVPGCARSYYGIDTSCIYIVALRYHLSDNLIPELEQYILPVYLYSDVVLEIVTFAHKDKSKYDTYLLALGA